MSEVSLVMNCKPLFHLEDLLSETEKAASVYHVRQHQEDQYWKLSHGLLSLLFAHTKQGKNIT